MLVAVVVLFVGGALVERRGIFAERSFLGAHGGGGGRLPALVEALVRGGFGGVCGVVGGGVSVPSEEADAHHRSGLWLLLRRLLLPMALPTMPSSKIMATTCQLAPARSRRRGSRLSRSAKLKAA